MRTKLSGENILAKLAPAIKATLEDPKADIGLTLIVVGVFTALLLFVVMLLLIAYFLISNRLAKKRRIVLPTRELTRREILISWSIFLALIAGLYWSIESYSSKPSTCAMCHTDQKHEKTLSQSSHKGINCLACHRRPGITGLLVQKLDYLRWTINLPELQNQNANIALKKSNELKLQAEISDRSCLRCHPGVDKGIVKRRGIRMRHYDVIQAGYRCTDCHNTVAHLGQVANPKRPSMEKCIVCHKEPKENGCDLCHVASEDQRLITREYIRTALGPPESCRGCHNVQAECTVCHGVEMPHSWTYKTKGHAMDGFLKKDACWRCHEKYDFCNKCHRFPSPHGEDPNPWRKAHGGAAKNPNVMVYWPEVDESFRGCNACHRSNMCDACHNDDGRRPVEPGSMHAN